MPISADRFKNLLSPFNLKNIKQVAKRLSNLTNDSDFESLEFYLEGLQTDVNCLTDQNLPLVIHYLELKKEKKGEGIFLIFEIGNLKKLHKFNAILKIDAPQFEGLCDAILQGASDKLVSEVLPNLNPMLLTSQHAVVILESILESCPPKEMISVLNFLAKNSDSLEQLMKVVDADQIGTKYIILEKLEKLQINTTSLDDWKVVVNLSESWYQNQNIIIGLKKSLNEKFFTPNGMKYILTHFEPKDFNERIIAGLNRLVNIFITDTKLETPWERLGNALFSNAAKTEENIRWIDQLITFIPPISNPKEAQQLKFFLLENEKFFREVNNLSIIQWFLKLDSKMHCTQGVEFFVKKLQNNPNININENYINAFNAIIKKPQIAYLRDFIFHISPQWLTEEGLIKLNQIPERYLTPEGLKAISKVQDVSQVTDKVIEKMKNADHDVFIKFFTVTKDDSNFESHIVRMNKLHTLISLLHSSITSDEGMKTKNAKSLMEDDCVVTEQKIISTEKSDEPIIYLSPEVIKEVAEKKDLEEKNAMLFEILNEKLCMIKKGEDFTICSRAFAEESLKINGNHFYDTKKKLTPDDIIKLSSNNLDIDYIKGILFKENVDSARISYFEELLSSPSRLSDLPLCLFSEDENFLLNLDLRYLTHSGMLTYLKKFLKNNFLDDATLSLLNTAADSIFNKFSKHDNISPILESLPDKYFTLSFTPEVFASIPENWLRGPIYLQMLTDTSIDLTPIDFKEGYTMLQLAETDIEFAIKNFNTLANNKNNFYSVYPGNSLLKILLKHIENEQFEVLLEPVVHLLSAQLSYLDQNSDEFDPLWVKLYRYACVNEEQHFREIFSELRLKTRIYLTPDQDVDLSKLNEFKNLTKPLITNLVSKLLTYFNNYLKIDGSTVKSRLLSLTKPQRVAAFSKIVDTLDIGDDLAVGSKLEVILQKVFEKETIFADLIVTITEQQDNIGYQENTHSREGLQLCTQEYIEAARNKMNEKFLPLLMDYLDDSDTLRAALLDDFFYSLLLEKNMVLLAKRSSEVFFEVMEIYRPAELIYYLQRKTDCGRTLTQLYIEYNSSKSNKEISLEKNETEKEEKKKLNNSAPTELMKENRASKFQKPEPPKGKVILTLSETDAITENHSKTGQNGHSKIPQNHFFGKSAPRKKLKRIDRKVKQHQLLDIDINAGMLYLLDLLPEGAIKKDSLKKLELPSQEIKPEQEIKEVSNSKLEENGHVENKGKKREIVYLPIGIVTEDEKADATSTLKVIEAKTYNNKGKICYGVMNYYNMHYVSLFVYTPPQDSKAPTQVLILDPAFESDEDNSKTTTIKEIETIFSKRFPDWKILKSPRISQQLNGTDCGICGLQNGKDTLEKDLVTIENDQLVFHADRLTLYGEKFIGKEEEFDKLSLEIRKWWEDRLCLVTYNCQMDVDGKFITTEEDIYDYNLNKEFQSLKKECEDLLSEITNAFDTQKIRTEIKTILKKNPLLMPLNNEALKQFVLDFTTSNQICRKYFEKLSEIQKIAQKVNGEHFALSEQDVIDNLFGVISRLDCDVKCDLFEKDFFGFLVKENDVFKAKDNSFLKNLEKSYARFLQTSQHKEWIEFYQKGTKWNHFKNINLRNLSSLLSEHNKKITRLSRLSNFAATVNKGEKPNVDAQSLPKSQGTGKDNPSSTTVVEVPGTSHSPEVSVNKTEESPLPEEKSKNNLQDTDKKIRGPILTMLKEIQGNLARTPKVKKFLSNTESYPKEVQELLADSYQWEEWFEHNDDLQSIYQQALFIVHKLFMIIDKGLQPGLFGRYYVDQNSLPHLIKVPVCRLMGFTQKDIEKYDKSEMTEVNVRSSANEPSKKEQLAGYEALLRILKSKIERFKENHNLPEFNQLEDLAKNASTKQLSS